jgi:hypothetical protein
MGRKPLTQQWKIWQRQGQRWERWVWSWMRQNLQMMNTSLNQRIRGPNTLG